MRLSKIKIDGLTVFYILSLGALGISWKYGLINLKEKPVLVDKTTLNLEDNIRFDSVNHSVYAYNPSRDFIFSTNGGKNWKNGGHEYCYKDVRIQDISLIPTSIRWKHPYEDVATITSFRYVVQDANQKTRSDYKVFTDVSSVKTDLPIIHLSVNEDDLFDDFTGILVQGAASWHNSDFQEAWWYRDANYTQRGYEWEKEIIFQYFEDNTELLQTKCGLRISGNATRGFPQKSLRINARKHFGKTKFKHRFFGKEGHKKYESLVLRMSGNDNTRTLFADLLMHQIAFGSDLIVQNGKPTLMYINGNYWGIYNLRERIDDYLISKHSDCKEREVTILEDGAAILKDGDEKEQIHFLDLIEEVRSMKSVGEEELDKIKNEIDLNSYMDYIFFETYYANNDWPDNNAICYKVPGEKWRWLLNDLDYSLAYPGVENVNTNMFERLAASSSVHAVLFNKIITNKEFKEKFKKRCQKNIEEYLNEQRVTEIFTVLKRQYEPEIEQQINRWRNISSVDQWEQNCQMNLDFLINRKKIYNKQLEEL